MVPIYESDLAEQRWAEADWEQYELWEKVEIRLKRSRKRWTILTLTVMIILFSFPILRERSEKWHSQKIARLLANKISLLKREASIRHVALSIHFTSLATLAYDIHEGPTCAPDALKKDPIEQGSLLQEYPIELISPLLAQELGLPGVVTQYCYDPLTGSSYPENTSSLIGFAFAPSDDLKNSRIDRASLLLVSGPSGELSFE